jgi:hypothetical protein
VVAPGGSAGGAWWRNFTDPYPVEVRLDAAWLAGIGQLVPAEHPGRPAAVRTYRARFPHVHPRAADPLLVITLLPATGNG